MNEEHITSTAAGTPKKASGCLTILAIFLVIAFVFSALVGLIGFNIWRVLFNPPLVKQALTAEVVSSDLVPATLEIFSEWRAEQRVKNNESLSGVSEPDIVLLISYLNMEDWRQIKQLLVTDEFVTNLVSVSVDGLYHWLDSSDLWPTFMWDMRPLKSRVTGRQGMDGIMVAYSALPVCTDVEVADLKKRLSEAPPGVEVLYNLCQFPAPWHEDQVSDYVDSLKGVNENIPDQFNFSEILANGQYAGAANPAQFKIQLKALRAIAQWTWLVALVLLLVILAIRVRSWRASGQFIGIPLTISGLLAILVAWGGQASINQYVTKLFLEATSPLARQAVEGSLKHLTTLFFQPLLIQGIILAGLGFVLIALMFIIKPKS